MKASENTLQPVIEGAKQFVVPLFQRPYSWTRSKWQNLWDDLDELCDSEDPRSHFIGSIVTMQTASVPEGVPKFLLIDGQQRLTTIFVFLSLLRNAARSAGDEELAEEIDKTLLVNPYKKGNDHFKILPTQRDRAAFHQLIKFDGTIPGGLLGSAYSFFERKLKDVPIGRIQRLKKVISEQLSVVSIVLDKDDNPYLVFESLNAKGEPLTQADLVRNFFFLKIHADHQEEIHARLWEPMENALEDRLTEFIRHHLMGDGSAVRNDSVYFTLKERLGSGDATQLLERLSASAKHYRKLLHPSEAEPELRDGLAHLNRLEVSTAYPFLLRCYEEVAKGTLARAEFRSIIDCIENFIVRRFVCSVPTNQLNKIFAPLFNQIQSGGHASLPEGIRRILAAKGYPKDAEFRSRLIDTKLYGPSDRLSKTRFLLECIDRSFGHKEAVDYEDKLTIEHVMPQSLTEDWKTHLGDQWEVTHELLLHTLGNLTLTKYNSELSNTNFFAKQAMLAQSHFSMNDYFATVSTWKEEDIEVRAEKLADITVQIWPDFGTEASDATEPSIVATSGRPKSLSFMGQRHEVASWRDVLEVTLNTIAERDPDEFETIAVAMPRLFGDEPSKFISSRQLKNGKFFNTHFSAKSTNRFCLRSINLAGIDPDQWVVSLE